MKIKYAHVGLGGFSLQRLRINLDNNIFEPVAFIDTNLEKKKEVSNLINGNNFFSSITEARKNIEFDACIIHASADVHSELVIESIQNDLHTFCVKPIACDMSELKNIIKVKSNKQNLLLVQGQNNQWNEASIKMSSIVNDKSLFGEFLNGHCLMWGMQDLSSIGVDPDTDRDGIFFHSMGCHQLSQLVSSLGLPKYVTSVSQRNFNYETGYRNSRTSYGNCLLEYDDGSVFSYVGNRGGHGNPFGFASRWSGNWIFHGTKSDLVRNGGRISVFQKGKVIRDLYLKDLDEGLYEDDKKQLNEFGSSIKNKIFSMQKNSLETWLLMEACNISSREKSKININQIKEEINFNKII
jgi:predicted dehydrogenase